MGSSVRALQAFSVWPGLGSNVQHGVVERSIVVDIDGYHSAGKLHRVCRVRDCSVVIVRHLSSVVIVKRGFFQAQAVAFTAC